MGPLKYGNGKGPAYGKGLLLLGVNREIPNVNDLKWPVFFWKRLTALEWRDKFFRSCFGEMGNIFDSSIETMGLGRLPRRKHIRHAFNTFCVCFLNKTQQTFGAYPYMIMKDILTYGLSKIRSLFFRSSSFLSRRFGQSKTTAPVTPNFFVGFFRIR